MLPRTCSGELYAVLELDARCTTAEVAQQYRRLALRYHPDRNAGATVVEFQRLEEAHRVLSDPQQRQLYDAVGREGLKQLGGYGGGMLGSLLLAVGNLAVGCVFLGFMAAALFVSLLLSCFKVDAPDEWPSWGVVLLPLWFLFPTLLLCSLVVMLTSIRHGFYILLLPSLRLLFCAVVAATSAAALDQRITPIAAFIPWLIWYALGTASDVATLVPTVYVRTRRTGFEETASPANHAEGRQGGSVPFEDPLLHPDGVHRRAKQSSDPSQNTGLADADFNEDSSPSCPWKTARYWQEVAEVIFEAVCVYVFFGLVLRRAIQQQQRQRSKAQNPPLSFWVILSPLMVYFGVYLVTSVVESFFANMPPSEGDWASNQERGNAARGDSTEATTASTHRSASSSPSHRRSSGELLANVVIRGFPPACGLYMTCMWAAKEEFEYNGRSGGADPSAFLAFLPILVNLGAFAALVCCGGCVMMCIGGSLASAGEGQGTPVARPPAARSGSSGTGATARASATADSNREGGYRSTASTVFRSGGSAGATAAKDVLIEQLD